MTNYYSIIPFIVSFVLLMRGKKTYVAMLTAAFTGIVINYLLAASHTLPLFTLQNWFDDVVKGNISTIVSIYLLGLLMNIITHSKIIVCANQWLEKHAFSNSIFITIVPVLSVLLSQDDYLSCLSTGTIAAQLSADYSNTFKLLSVAAAISGSLFAIFSYSSDTTALCAQSTTSKIQEIRKVQFPLAKRILIIGIIGYILLAKCINQPSGYLLTILCIVLCYTFSLSTHKFTKRHYIVVYKAYIKLQTINLTYNGNPKLIKLKEYAKHYWKRITCKKSLYCFRIL